MPSPTHTPTLHTIGSLNKIVTFFSDASQRDVDCLDTTKCLYSYRDDLPENLGKTTVQECITSTTG